jgi:Protein of unknown function (DUF2809)
VIADSVASGGNRLRPILIYLGLAAATIVAGLMLRLVSLGLPFAVTKWGGSVLWAWMVYWLLAAALAGYGWRGFRGCMAVALIACLLAALVELSRLYHSPGLDAFRLTLAGKLLLGRVFSGWHFVAYWASIAFAGLVDGRFVRKPQRPERGAAEGNGPSLRAL